MTWDIPALAKSLIDGVSKLIPDRDLQIKVKHEIEMLALKAQSEQLNAQAEINKVEAAHSSIWVSGWRPWIGWVAGTGMAWSFVLQPMFTCIYATITHEPAPVPALDMTALMTVLMGMLGFGLRTLEKTQGVAKS